MVVSIATQDRAVVARKEREQGQKRLEEYRDHFFEEVSSSAKAATKNAMTPEESFAFMYREGFKHLNKRK